MKESTKPERRWSPIVWHMRSMVFPSATCNEVKNVSLTKWQGLGTGGSAYAQPVTDNVSCNKHSRICHCFKIPTRRYGHLLMSMNSSLNISGSEVTKNRRKLKWPNSWVLLFFKDDTRQTNCLKFCLFYLTYCLYHPISVPAKDWTNVEVILTPLL
jgi:hypothetical protein